MTRPRVVALIAAAAASPLTLVVAPAGSGKSIALGAFLAQAGPHRFFDATSDVNVVRWLDESDGFDGVVALDAIDRLDASAIEALVAAIDRSISTQRWILATRSTEGLPVGTWLAYGRAARVIGRTELSFTTSEARDEVVAFTSGWAVAASFAERLARSGTDFRAVREQTREMMRSFLDERFYGDISERQRELLEIASVLPAIDVALLERAGFPDAYHALQCIAARTGIVWETAAGRFACNEVVTDFLRRRLAMRERAQRAQLYERVAAALESSGAIGEALDAYVAAELRDGVVRLLHERGLQLLDRAHVDVVHRAIDVLEDKIKREDSAILTLRGVAHAAKGRPVRAEGLLRRALTRAGSNKPAHAAATLRLSLLLANRGDDAGGQLESLAVDDDHCAEARAEAWSILAAQRALSGNISAAKAAVDRVTELLPSIERDDVRAKVLQRIGVAAINTNDVERARSSLEEAAELAMELELYSLASRAYIALCSLALEENDDVDRHRSYSYSAIAAAKRADNAFDIQTALIQGLRAEMLSGNEDASSAIEAQLLALRTGDETRAHALSSFRAVRMAWNGKFSEAHFVLRKTWSLFHYDFDRVMAGSLCGLFLAVDGRHSESSQLVRDVVRQASGIRSVRLFARRRVAVARLYCAVAESINGRPLQAATIVRQIPTAEDPIIALAASLAGSITTSVRQAIASDVESERADLARLAAHGYADASRVLEAIRGALEKRKFLKRMSLTPAEVAVLRHLNLGQSPKEIAVRTGRSVFTVRAHVANAIEKLQCHGRAEAIAAARRLGLID